MILKLRVRRRVLAFSYTVLLDHAFSRINTVVPVSDVMISNLEASYNYHNDRYMATYDLTIDFNVQEHKDQDIESIRSKLIRCEYTIINLLCG